MAQEPSADSAGEFVIKAFLPGHTRSPDLIDLCMCFMSSINICVQACKPLTYINSIHLHTCRLLHSSQIHDLILAHQLSQSIFVPPWYLHSIQLFILLHLIKVFSQPKPHLNQLSDIRAVCWAGDGTHIATGSRDMRLIQQFLRTLSLACTVSRCELDRAIFVCSLTHIHTHRCIFYVLLPKLHPTHTLTLKPVEKFGLR